MEHSKLKANMNFRNHMHVHTWYPKIETASASDGMFIVLSASTAGINKDPFLTQKRTSTCSLAGERVTLKS